MVTARSLGVDHEWTRHGEYGELICKHCRTWMHDLYFYKQNGVDYPPCETLVRTNYTKVIEEFTCKT
jgi:hypothetical protein